MVGSRVRRKPYGRTGSDRVGLCRSAILVATDVDAVDIGDGPVVLPVLRPPDILPITSDGLATNN